MKKLFIEDLSINQKKVLLRADFNVPLDNELNVVDATRIEATLPSINYVLQHNGILILMSHLGRPNNEFRSDLSLAPIARLLSSLLDKEVILAPDCIGDRVRDLVDHLKPGDVLLLENLRFHRAEEHPEEDPTFAQQLAQWGDCYINDAFGAAHRKHSSTYTIARFFPSQAAAGYLMEKEIRFLGETLHNPQRPFYAILGGAKISTKLGAIRALLKQVDQLFIGGAMAYTFFKAEGIAIGKCPIEESLIPIARDLLKEYREKILLPIDIRAAQECSEKAPFIEVMVKQGFPQGYEGLDIGPQTIQMYSERLKEAKTILWNGPLGVYEIDSFAKGTYALAHTLSTLNAITIIGGGDLLAAVNNAGVANKMTHLSTGGGATLEYIEYGTLPGIEALSNARSREKSAP